MPRVETLRLFGVLWAAWTLNDLGQRGPVRYGWSEDQARMRAARG
jgi:hypothetical protein